MEKFIFLPSSRSIWSVICASFPSGPFSDYLIDNVGGNFIYDGPSLSFRGDGDAVGRYFIGNAEFVVSAQHFALTQLF